MRPYGLFSIILLAVTLCALPAESAMRCNNCHGASMTASCLPPPECPECSSCDNCHFDGRAIDDPRPLDSSFRDMRTGGFQGNHRNHMDATATPATCNRCHPGSDGNTSAHRDGFIKVSGHLNGSPLTTPYKNTTSGWFQTSSPVLDDSARCSNVNCHFETRTPVWGTRDDPFGNFACNQCHGYPPLGTAPDYAGGAKGSHDLPSHEGFTCDRCHTDHLSEDNPFRHANDIGTKKLVINPPDPLNIFFGSYSAVSTGDYLPSQAATHVFGSCKVSCHSTIQGGSDGRAEPQYGMPVWGASPGNPGNESRGCAMNCHRVGSHFSKGSGDVETNIPIATGSHTKHLAGKGTPIGNCPTCHYMINPPSQPRPPWVATGLSLYENMRACAWCHNPFQNNADLVKRHLEGTVGINLITGATYGGAQTPVGKIPRTGFTACGNTYCHSDGTALATGTIPASTSPVWGSGELSCTGCHGMPPAYATGAPKVNSHGAHLFACNTCHFRTTTDGTTIANPLLHADQAYTVNPGPAIFLNYSYASTGGTCSSVSCHSDGTSVATGQTAGGTTRWGAGSLTCNSCHGYPPAYLSGTPKTNSHGKHSIYGCNKCHSGTTANGTTITNTAFHGNNSYDLTPGEGVSFSYAYASTGGTCSSISCHGNGSASWGATLGCDGCHDAPPATASHLKHYGGTVAQAAYGDTRITQNFGSNGTAYIFGCGNCHPMNPASHNNGTCEVELYNAAATAGSPKKISPASASYTPGATVYSDSRGYPYTNGTCDNIYCHSYRSWTTPSGVPNSTTCTPQVPADMVTTTHYRTVMWGGAPLDCAGCHANPPRTRDPENGGAAGDSHSWIGPVDPYVGSPFEYMHNNNMFAESMFPPYPTPISCMYCHNDTVRQPNTNTWDFTDPAVPVIMSNVPISNFSNHVNGRNDVAFERQIPVPAIGDWSGRRLVNATYAPATKTCSNVACHTLRTDVVWGTPYKGGIEEGYACARCHNFGTTCQDAATALSRQPSITSTPGSTVASPGYLYSYSVSASEPGGAALTYSLPTKPNGMTISSTGLVNWYPTTLGSFPVTVQANNGSLIALQDFIITVVEPRPVITSTPNTTATEGKAYSYRVTSTVPSGVPAATYAVTTSPTGMTINSTTGYISWTPTGSQVGSAPVTATASVGSYSTSQTFTITTGASPITITSTPVLTATAGVQYRYTVTAVMDGITTGFTYSLVTKPSTPVMSIGSATGLITWTPGTAQKGNSYPVVVKATKSGNSKLQSFSIYVP